MGSVREHIGQADILETADAVVAIPRPPDTYLGVAGHLLSDIRLLARAVPPSGIGLPMLCAHALECILKGYLSRSGDDTRVRKVDVRHNLVRLWTMAFADWLRISEEPPGWVVMLSALHDGPDYHLRYATGINGIVTPVPGTIANELAQLLELVLRSVQFWRAASR
jgi:hypothetical protein